MLLLDERCNGKGKGCESNDQPAIARRAAEADLEGERAGGGWWSGCDAMQRRCRCGERSDVSSLSLSHTRHPHTPAWRRIRRSLLLSLLLLFAGGISLQPGDAIDDADCRPPPPLQLQQSDRNTTSAAPPQGTNTSATGDNRCAITGAMSSRGSKSCSSR